MPGTRDGPVPLKWFQKAFGFAERSWEETQSNFEFSDGVLKSKVNSASFHVGPFELVSMPELEECLKTLEKPAGLSGLTFENIVGDTGALHRDSSNAGAVFQVTSLFNCCHGLTPDEEPEDGVSSIGSEATQGAACAVSCPAATVFRHYFVNGRGQAEKQLNCLSRVSEAVKNSKENFYTMKNGFCMPRPPNGVARLSKKLAGDPIIVEDVLAGIQVGVHWDTEVWTPPGLPKRSSRAGSSGGLRDTSPPRAISPPRAEASIPHRVCQVLCSALPISFSKSTRSREWEFFARLVLTAMYDLTLTVASLLARQRQARVLVYLTAVGGGLLGNRHKWIVDAIEKALRKHAGEPLDVMLVHYAKHPREEFRSLEAGRQLVQTPLARRTISQDVRKLASELDDVNVVERSMSGAQRIVQSFNSLDANGDGYIDRGEFLDMLQSLDRGLFTEENVDRLVHEADSDGDGVIHYAEFAAFLCGNESVEADRILASRKFGRSSVVALSPTDRKTTF